MNIQECKGIEDYLQMCGVTSIDSLTKEQLFGWVKAGKTDIITKNSLWIVEHGKFGDYPDESEAISLIKQAIREKKSFRCGYVTNESYGRIDKSKTNKRERFIMMVD